MAATCVHRNKKRFYLKLIDELTISYDDLDRREKKIAEHFSDFDHLFRNYGGSEGTRRRHHGCQARKEGHLNKSIALVHRETAKLAQESKTLVEELIKVDASIQKSWIQLQRLDRECSLQGCSPLPT